MVGHEPLVSLTLSRQISLFSSEPPSQRSRFALRSNSCGRKDPAQAHSIRRDAASMTRSQFVLYMSQPSIVVTLKIVHEQQSKKGKGEES